MVGRMSIRRRASVHRHSAYVKITRLTKGGVDLCRDPGGIDFNELFYQGVKVFSGEFLVQNH